ncbi:MAG: glycolate oxidase subunit GlcE, partial [Burkholderiaceae bacterium]|nr:glycolate oxidase subunit GlcE [Burkholderiaceae bacterium]
MTSTVTSSATPEQQLQLFTEQIQAATAQNMPLCLQGGGSKQWYGQVPQGHLLDTRPYTGIVA